MTWDTFARRNHAPLSARLLQEAQRKPSFERATGIPFGLRNHAWIGDTIYIPTTEVNGLGIAVKSVAPFEDWSFFAEFSRRCRAALEELAETATASAAVAGNPDLSEGELSERTLRWLAAYRQAMAFVPVFRVIDRVLETYIPADQVAGFLAGVVGHVTEETRERQAIGTIVSELRNCGDLFATTDEAVHLIDDHVREFGWLRTRWYLGDPFTSQDVRQRIVALLSAEAIHTSTLSAESKESSSSDADPQKQIVDELAFLRSFRAEAINKAIWDARPLFEAITQRTGVRYEDLVQMLPDELIGLINGTAPSPAELESRREIFATILLDDVFSERSGATDVENLRRQIGVDVISSQGGNAAQPSEESGVVLRGVAASPGCARGPVRIVHSADDDSSVESGDILVTTMTYPSLVGAMQRSAAIITDDGGLLSHAAVTARELQKPCLINTEVATQVLADGDTVEVDCNVGLVRLIEAASKSKNERIQQ